MTTLSRFVGAIATLSFAFAPTALPGQRSAPDQQAGTQILFLATAAGPPLRADRSEPAALLIVDGRRYLIDCGIGTARRLVQAGIPSETIGTIFFTHLHADHALGLADAATSSTLT
jgi:ribonuclease BN (tRNA processing enzyme)